MTTHLDYVNLVKENDFIFRDLLCHKCQLEINWRPLQFSSSCLEAWLDTRRCPQPRPRTILTTDSWDKPSLQYKFHKYSTMARTSRWTHIYIFYFIRISTFRSKGGTISIFCQFIWQVVLRHPLLVQDPFQESTTSSHLPRWCNYYIKTSNLWITSNQATIVCHYCTGNFVNKHRGYQYFSHGIIPWF